MVKLAKGLMGRANLVISVVVRITDVTDHGPETAKPAHLFNQVTTDGDVKRLEWTFRVGLRQELLSFQP